MSKKRKQYDWEVIEREYCLGQKSLRCLSKEFGPGPSTISERARRHGWVQDKSEEIKRKTNAALTNTNSEPNTPTQDDINRAVQTNVQVIREHRKDIGNGMKMVTLLTEQLRFAADNREDLEGEIFKDTEPRGEEDKPDLKRRNAMLKAVSLPMHASTLRDLSTTLKNLIPLERQAFNLDEKSNGLGDEIEKIKIELVSPNGHKS